jgi:hypothetical protein
MRYEGPSQPGRKQPPRAETKTGFRLGTIPAVVGSMAGPSRQVTSLPLGAAELQGRREGQKYARNERTRDRLTELFHSLALFLCKIPNWCSSISPSSCVRPYRMPPSYTYPLTVAMEAECSRPADRLPTHADREQRRLPPRAPACPANRADGSALRRAPVLRPEVSTTHSQTAAPRPGWPAGR